MRGGRSHQLAVFLMGFLGLVEVKNNRLGNAWAVLRLGGTGKDRFWSMGLVNAAV